MLEKEVDSNWAVLNWADLSIAEPPRQYAAPVKTAITANPIIMYKSEFFFEFPASKKIKDKCLRVYF